MTFIALPIMPGNPIGPFGGVNPREVWIIAIVLAGDSVATAVSFLRVFAIAAVLQPKLLLVAGPTLIGAATAAIGVGLTQAFWLNADGPQANAVKFRNPFGFWSVVGLALSLGVIIVLGRAVGESFGAEGAIAGAIVVGLVDVDSVAVAMARLPSYTLSLEGAAYAILAAAASDTVSKVAIGAVIGRGRFAAQIGIMAALCLSIAAAVLGLTLVLSGARGM